LELPPELLPGIIQDYYEMTSKKEKRIQALRNKVPKEIVKLIISFVNYNPTFQAIYNKIHTHYPFTNYYKYYFCFEPYRFKPSFSQLFELVGNSVQSADTIDIQFSHKAVEGSIMDIRDYFRDLRHDTKNVFYTKNIKHKHDILGEKQWYHRLILEIYEALMPNFQMEEARTPLKWDNETGYPLLNFKITAKGVAQKKAVSNFFNGIGRFIEWMRYEALPIHRVAPKDDKLVFQ
jgi:hypothetical protein